MEWWEDGAFAAAVRVVLGHEGGYVANPQDPGGATKYGISQRSYPNLDIRALGPEQAAAIYYRDWWLRYGYGRLPARLAAKLLDLAVTAPQPAHQSLQRALRAGGMGDLKEDGVLGPLTVAAAGRCPQAVALAALRSEFAGYCRLVAVHYEATHGCADPFLEGWLNRSYE